MSRVLSFEEYNINESFSMPSVREGAVEAIMRCLYGDAGIRCSDGYHDSKVKVYPYIKDYFRNGKPYTHVAAWDGDILNALKDGLKYEYVGPGHFCYKGKSGGDPVELNLWAITNEEMDSAIRRILNKPSQSLIFIDNNRSYLKYKALDLKGKSDEEISRITRYYEPFSIIDKRIENGMYTTDYNKGWKKAAEYMDSCYKRFIENNDK